MRKSLIALGVAAVAAPLTTLALTVTINGASFDATSVTIDTNGDITISEGTGVTVTGGGSTSSSSSSSGTTSSSSSSSSSGTTSSSSSSSSSGTTSSSSSSGTDPTPDPDANCPSTPSGVDVGGAIDMNKRGQILLRGTNNGIVSMPFQSPNSTTVRPRFSVTTYSSSYDTVRTAWISTCPGGDALPEASCTKASSNVVSLRAEMADSSPGYCSMAPDTKYYLNVHSDSCSGYHCQFYFDVRW